MNAKRARILEVVRETATKEAEHRDIPVTVLVEFLRFQQGDLQSVLVEVNTRPDDVYRIARTTHVFAKASQTRAMQAFRYEGRNFLLAVASGQLTPMDGFKDSEILETIEKAVSKLYPASKK